LTKAEVIKLFSFLIKVGVGLMISMQSTVGMSNDFAKNLEGTGFGKHAQDSNSAYCLENVMKL